MNSEPETTNSRREFLRILLLGSTVSMVAGRPQQAMAVASIVARAQPEGAMLWLSFSKYPQLAANFGSVRVSFTALGQAGPVQPIIVTRDGDTFFAVSSECTHQGCTIPAFGASKTSTCPCHGSRYSIDGTVLNGPAPAPLPTYDVDTSQPDRVGVFLPEFPPYDVTIERVLSADSQRVSVSFLALRNIDYEVLGRSSVAEPWAPRNFALTESGAATQAVFRGQGVSATLFVELVGTSALIAVAAREKKV